MELQTQIDELKTSSKRQKFAIIALMSLVVFIAVKPYGQITCKGWRIVDKDGNERINAGILSDGQASVQVIDKNGKMRISTATDADGQAGVQVMDKDGKMGINVLTFANGQASVQWLDKDGKLRIGAAVMPDGTVRLPMRDLK